MAAQRISAGVYGIVDPDRTTDPVRTVRAWTGAGVRTVQLRWKTAPARDYLELARRLDAVCRQSGTLFVVNDRVDVARLLRSACHIGPEDLPLKEVRNLLGPRAIIGVSTNSAPEARRMEKAGADYVGFGPLFPTASKDRLRPFRTLKELEAVAAAVSIPVIGIGGISEATLGDVLHHGARAGAIIGALHGDNPGALARALEKESRRALAQNG